MSKLPRLKDSALEQRLDILGDKLDGIMCLLRRMEKAEMSRYTDLLEKVRGIRSQGAALKEILKTLDGGSEAEYQALTAELQSHAEELAAAIRENTPEAPPSEGGSTGGV